MSEQPAGCLIMVVIVGVVVWNWDDIVSGVSELFHDEIESNDGL